MEGFIPFIYRAVVQYRKEGQVSLGDLFFDEPSPSSYFRLPATPDGTSRRRAASSPSPRLIPARRDGRPRCGVKCITVAQRLQRNES
ncbi:hypothetical protein ABZP36_014140 [Zizania latifolia]